MYFIFTVVVGDAGGGDGVGSIRTTASFCYQYYYVIKTHGSCHLSSFEIILCVQFVLLYVIIYNNNNNNNNNDIQNLYSALYNL